MYINASSKDRDISFFIEYDICVLLNLIDYRLSTQYNNNYIIRCDYINL